MTYPRPLKPGATIGLVCTSSPVTTERISQCVGVLTDMGYQVRLADNLDAHLHGLMAGEGKARGEWINRMFADPEIDAIFCVRGGDGSSRIMEYLDADLIRQNPKIFVGYSDVTNLHLFLVDQCDLVTFHGPMVSSNMVDHWDAETERSFWETLGAEGTWTYQNPAGKPLKTIRPGQGTGLLIGGNLSLLAAAMGTPYALQSQGRILFIEEVKEQTSKIEKWIWQLRNAGALAGLAGLLLGQFTNMTVECDADYDAVACITEACQGYDFPIVAGVESGHAFPMMTLPFGAPCTIQASAGQTPKMTLRADR